MKALVKSKNEPGLWLEDVDSERAMSWVRAENAKTVAVLESDPRYHTLYEQALAIFRKVRGEEHPDTLTSISNLTSIYSNQGRWKEAEGLGIRLRQ